MTELLVMKAAFAAVASDQCQYIGQKYCKFRFAHFTGSHHKFAVLDFPVTTDMSGNGKVVGWISKYNIRLLIFHQSSVAARI